jgi:hypothetical protein
MVMIAPWTSTSLNSSAIAQGRRIKLGGIQD